MITRAQLASRLTYDPETGIFARGIGRKQTTKRAGTINGQGYRQIMIDGSIIGEHRLAFLWMTGKFPEAEVDHVNLDKADNRWANLRPATRSQNMANKTLDDTNTSGLKGVGWHKRAGKWRARVQADGEATHLGLYDCRAAAHFAYLVASAQAFGAFSRAA
jgi:HNH endonuclease